MPITQMVYASRPFGFDDSILSAILNTARRRNAEDGITGTLICRADLYLQMLEGPAQKVAAAYQRIRNDDRHLEVTQLVQRRITTRLFADWAMRDDPVRSWMWTREAIHEGAVQRAGEDQILGIFQRVAAECGKRPQLV